MSEVLIEVRDLKKHFKTPKGMLHAVDGVNFTIKKGTTLGVVGESGCGKTTIGRVVLRLLEATGGQVIFKGKNIIEFDKKEIQEVRKEMQMIFQDPLTSLDPRKSVYEIIKEPLDNYKIHTNKEDYERHIKELMETVGLAERYMDMYPHELDGGRRQRIGVARALALKPDFIVCDEPVSALDVSIQAQILNLLMDLQDEHGMAYMFITHDLSVVKHISHEIVVMYLGQCVEYASTDAIFKNTLHPYTKGLLEAVPTPTLDAKLKATEIMKGELSSPIEPPPGCRFVNRCPQASKECRGRDIPLKEIEPGHFVACTLYE